MRATVFWSNWRKANAHREETKKVRGNARRVVLTLAAVGLLFLKPGVTLAADPQIDALLRAPIGKDWVTNGGNLTNQRYSTLKQINTANVKQLKGAWMTRLKGSGLGGKYSFEGSPLVKDGIMYVVTGNDDVFALNAKTGEIVWEYWSGIDQRISTVCCGWVNRGLAMGEGLIFLGQLDANVVALDMKTGKVAWKTPIEKWENGYGITSAPLYYDGIIYSGITGGEFGVRGRLTALDAKTGKILWVTARAGRDRLRDLAARYRSPHARRRDDLEYARARSRARPCLLRGRQLRTRLRRFDA
jgi:alcohol dehydrogenase (cytochrome c)